MKVLKPGWIHLEGRQIFSIDIDPFGRFLAISGQGDNNCGLIAVFNFEPFLKYCSSSGEVSDDVPKKLFEMTNHLGCVNCVRWSPNGKMLASGSDDRMVMIWQPAFSAAASNGNRKRYPDTAKCICMLREHTGDVLDVAWNRDSSLLASCSIDNSIIVWNATKFPVAERIVILKKHSGLVKGICFDPAGVYLASQADDKTLIVWRTSDWSVETKITEPFKQCSGSTHVLRLSWSPDGQTLVTAHAMNAGGPTAQLVSRGPPWSTNVDLAGHRRAVTCSRFHPRLFIRPADPPLQASQNGAVIASENDKSDPFCAVAIGSRDRSVSVWLTNLRRPRLVLQDVFSDSVLDLAWYGLCLFACSNDGTVTCLLFAENELGKLCSDKDTEAALQSACSSKDYKRPDKVIIQSAALLAERKKLALSTDQADGAQKQQKTTSSAAAVADSTTSVKRDPFNGSTNNNAESAATAKSDEQQPSSTSTTTAASSSAQRPSYFPNSSTTQSPFPTATGDLRGKCLSPQPTALSSSKQFETKLPNGKRRITPMVVPVEPLSPNGFSLFDNIQNGSVVMENGRPQTATPGGSQPATTPQQAAIPSDGTKPAIPNGSEIQAKQTDESAAPKADASAAPAPPTANGVDVVKVTASRFVGVKPCTEELKASKTVATKRALNNASASNAQLKRRPGRPPLSGKKRHNRIDSSSSESGESSSGERSGAAEQQQQQQPTSERPATVAVSHVQSVTVSSLIPAKLPSTGRNSISVDLGISSTVGRFDAKQFVVSTAPLDDHTWLLDCSPATASSSSQQPHQNRLWLQLLPAPCVAFAASRNMVAVADSSARVSLFALKSGARLAGPFVLQSQVAFLEVVGWRCLVVLAGGTLRLWDAKPPASLSCVLSVSSLPHLNGNERFRRCFIADCGSPALVSSSGRSFLYSSQQQEWLELGEAVCQSLKGDLGSSLSNAISNAKISLGNLSAKVLGNIDYQRATLKDALARNVILAAEMRSVDNYLTAMMSYFRFLVKEDNGAANSISFESEIRELLGSLLCASGKSFLSKTIRSDLLRDLLACLATNLRYQQLFVEIESQINADDDNQTTDKDNVQAMNCD